MQKLPKKMVSQEFAWVFHGDRCLTTKTYIKFLRWLQRCMKWDLKNAAPKVCLSYEQAERLKEAGCFAYNHNLDTSREYYDKIITTRTYDDRLETLKIYVALR